MTRAAKKDFYSGLVIDGQDVTSAFILSAVVTIALRFFLDWPVVIFVILTLALIQGYRMSRKVKKYQGTDILATIAASSLVLVIFEYVITNG